MFELENLKKQLCENYWFDAWLVLCFRQNARTQEEQIEIAKEMLSPSTKYWQPRTIRGFMIWSMEAYEAKATHWLRCHLSETDLSAEEYQKLHENHKKNTFTL